MSVPEIFRQIAGWFGSNVEITGNTTLQLPIYLTLIGLKNIPVTPSSPSK